ncbi:MAG: hypothetical protein IKZ88_03520 [Neisseriaceae bacterium]|nr:hypothetical protein [Neisseriaceae bacterium]
MKLKSLLLTATCLMTASLAQADDNVDKFNKLVADLCLTHTQFSVDYSTALFTAKDEKEYKAVRTNAEKELKKFKDKEMVDFLFKSRMDYEDKAVKNALKIPHAQRLQMVESPEWKKQVEKSSAIYFEECRSSLMKK